MTDEGRLLQLEIDRIERIKVIGCCVESTLGGGLLYRRDAK
jgi:hypothetical protein